MRGTVAKRLRREVYGDKPTNAKGRTYSLDRRRSRFIADELRRSYQQAKKRHRRSP